MSAPPNTQQPPAPPSNSTANGLLTEWSLRYRAALVSYFRKRLRASGEVEDLVQEVFLRLVRQHELTAVRLVEPYLFQIASRVLTDHARAAAVRHLNEHESFEDEAHPTEVYAPETVLADREWMNRLLEALTELPETTRTIFMLRRWEDLPNADLARMLGMSVSAVEKHMSKALIHLKERMEREP